MIKLPRSRIVLASIVILEVCVILLVVGSIGMAMLQSGWL
jgi:hypothetical protein